MKLLIDDKNVIQAWEVVGNSWKNNPYCIEVDNIPEEVRNADVGAFCYSEEKGFYENPDYIPPETPTETITDTDILNVLLGVNE